MGKELCYKELCRNFCFNLPGTDFSTWIAFVPCKGHHSALSNGFIKRFVSKPAEIKKKKRTANSQYR